MADKFILRITAGSDYDDSHHVQVPVNRPETVSIRGDCADIELNVRIRDYRGLPPGSPTTSPYFDAEPHAANGDQYSICLRFTPKRKPTTTLEEEEKSNEESTAKEETDNNNNNNNNDDGISGADLQFGNDFDHPIRDRLPPGFQTALRIVKWWLDPGLDGDPYANSPYLYGPALSSFNVLRLGAGVYDPARGGLWIEEGDSEDDDDDDDSSNSEENAPATTTTKTATTTTTTRQALGIPDTSKARIKWALGDTNKANFVFGYGKTYGLDFFNPYLDFANLALRLPGFQLSLANYWDGQPLRYVLRNKTTADVYLVIVFSLHLRQDVGPDGTIKEGAGVTPQPQHEHEHDQEAALQSARRGFGTPPYETHDDDVD